MSSCDDVLTIQHDVDLPELQGWIRSNSPLRHSCGMEALTCGCARFWFLNCHRCNLCFDPNPRETERSLDSLLEIPINTVEADHLRGTCTGYLFTVWEYQPMAGLSQGQATDHLASRGARSIVEGSCSFPSLFHCLSCFDCATTVSTLSIR